MKYYMNKFTSLDTPMLVTLNDNSGKTLKTLVTNDKLKQTLSGYAVPQKEFFTFQTTDGVTLNGWMMKPVNFSASKKYPVLMYQYSDRARNKYWIHGESVGKPIWRVSATS